MEQIDVFCGVGRATIALQDLNMSENVQKRIRFQIKMVKGFKSIDLGI